MRVETTAIATARGETSAPTRHPPEIRSAQTCSVPMNEPERTGSRQLRLPLCLNCVPDARHDSVILQTAQVANGGFFGLYAQISLLSEYLA
jgi:hypothetical protein